MRLREAGELRDRAPENTSDAQRFAEITTSTKEIPFDRLKALVRKGGRRYAASRDRLAGEAAQPKLPASPRAQHRHRPIRCQTGAPGSAPARGPVAPVPAGAPARHACRFARVHGVSRPRAPRKVRAVSPQGTSRWRTRFPRNARISISSSRSTAHARAPMHSSTRRGSIYRALTCAGSGQSRRRFWRSHPFQRIRPARFDASDSRTRTATSTSSRWSPTTGNRAHSRKWLFPRNHRRMDFWTRLETTHASCAPSGRRVRLNAGSRRSGKNSPRACPGT